MRIYEDNSVSFFCKKGLEIGKFQKAHELLSCKVFFANFEFSEFSCRHECLEPIDGKNIIWPTL